MRKVADELMKKSMEQVIMTDDMIQRGADALMREWGMLDLSRASAERIAEEVLKAILESEDIISTKC